MTREGTHLDMEAFVLQRHYQHACEVSVDGPLARFEIGVQPHETGADIVTESEDGIERGPVLVCFWDFGVGLEISVSDSCDEERNKLGHTWQ